MIKKVSLFLSASFGTPHCDSKCLLNNRETNILPLFRPASTSYGLHSFKYFACKTWNSLPENI